MNIRSSMYRTVSLLIAIPFLLFSLIISYIFNDKLEKVITESLHTVANVQMAEMTNFCQQQMNNLTIVGDMDVTRAALRGDLPPGMFGYLNNMLDSRVQTTSYLRNTALIDVNNRVVACSEAHYETVAHDGLDNLIKQMENEPFYISDVLNAKDSHGQEYKTVVAIARIEYADQLLGYALAEINLDFYHDIRRQTELWTESTFYLLDGTQQIISAGTSMEDRDTFVTTGSERQDYNNKYNSIDFNKNPQGNFSYKLGGKNYITYYSNVQHTNWKFLLTINMDQYLARRTVYSVLAGMLVLLCSALALWIGSFTSRRIILPIKRISATMKDIQKEQNYALRVNVECNDELGNLSAEINELLGFIETENLHKAKQQRLLQQRADQDALTKVLNRERISQYLEEAIERHRADKTALAVLFVDVDNFKAFNSDYGHDVGDQVLLFLTALLTRETRGTAGRFGGDEFLIVMEDPEYVQALDACLNRVKERSITQFVIRGMGRSVPVTCCIGAVRIDFSADGKDAAAERLIKMADEAMYQAKKRGKHGHVILEYKD